MQIYSASEVFRTAHRWIEPKPDIASVGQGPQGINSVCICCKAEGDLLNPRDAQWASFNAFYQVHQWSAYQCPACSYQFSWFKTPI